MDFSSNTAPIDDPLQPISNFRILIPRESKAPRSKSVHKNSPNSKIPNSFPKQQSLCTSPKLEVFHATKEKKLKFSLISQAKKSTYKDRISPIDSLFLYKTFKLSENPGLLSIRFLESNKPASLPPTCISKVKCQKKSRICSSTQRSQTAELNTGWASPSARIYYKAARREIIPQTKAKEEITQGAGSLLIRGTIKDFAIRKLRNLRNFK